VEAPAPDASAGVPVIRVQGGILHDLATEAEFALIDAGAPFYTRGAQIVRPILDEVEAAKGHKTTAARLTAVSADVMLDYLSRSARWERFDRRSAKYVPTDPPRSVAATILSRDGEWMLRPLAGVLTTPTMRPDGSILSEPGYDPETRLLLLEPAIMPALVASPTREDALAALALLQDLLADFPFVDEGSRSVALSALITPIVRGAMPVAPLHAMRAPSPGSGKSYLVDLASAITTGQRCPVIAAGRSTEETEKRLGAAMLAGYPLISIDNLNGYLGGDALCQLIERPRVSIRPLGRSELVAIESRATVYATGNNIQPTGDVIRRVIICSLDPDLERPELRVFKHDPLALVLAERGRYIAAALTIVRAWLLAAKEDPVPPLASFEHWSHTVRSALLWLGKEDPVTTMETARGEDPELMVFEGLIRAWQNALGLNKPITSGALKSFAEQKMDRDLHQALLNAAGWRGDIDPRRLGNYFARHQNKITHGMKLISYDDKKLKQKQWSIIKVS
jgi:putative DNA primase/helicase